MTDPGWYSDPHKQAPFRYWDGQRWTAHTSNAVGPPPPVDVNAAPPPVAPKKAVSGRTSGRTKAAWIAVGIVALVVVGIASSSDENTGDDGSSRPATSAATSTPEPETARDRVESALDDAEGPVEDPEIHDARFTPGGVLVTAATPEGGLEGASTQDIDWQAQAIFTAIYDDTGYDKDAQVTLEGGLVDTSTGKDLPHAPTGVYEIGAGEAKRIDWGDQDALGSIDWSLYRTFASPALKQDSVPGFVSCLKRLDAPADVIDAWTGG